MDAGTLMWRSGSRHVNKTSQSYHSMNAMTGTLWAKLCQSYHPMNVMTGTLWAKLLDFLWQQTHRTKKNGNCIAAILKKKENIFP
jgi:hypothetical protein